MGGFTSQEGFEQFLAQMEKVTNKKPQDSANRLGNKIESNEKDNSEKIIQELKDKLGINESIKSLEEYGIWVKQTPGGGLKCIFPDGVNDIVYNGKKANGKGFIVENGSTFNKITHEKKPDGYVIVEFTDKNGKINEFKFRKINSQQNSGISENSTGMHENKDKQDGIEKTINNLNRYGIESKIGENGGIDFLVPKNAKNVLFNGTSLPNDGNLDFSIDKQDSIKLTIEGLNRETNATIKVTNPKGKTDTITFVFDRGNRR